MSGATPDGPLDARADAAEARPRRRRPSLIWLIPVTAALVAGYLAWTTYAARGPLITVLFDNAGGLVSGQTQVRYKAVVVGTVEGLALTEGLTRVQARLRMTHEAAPRLTESARFWVVRPRLTAGAVSGLETIVSGSYIEFDPGAPDAPSRDAFEGLADAPGVRSDEPGRVFTLRAGSIGSLDRGSPVFFRDVEVGEVLGYDPPRLDGEVMLRAFVRAPYDGYLRQGSRFWNTSGVGVQVGPAGIQLQVQSLRAVLAGGVAFDTPPALRDTGPPAGDAVFQLHENLEAAAAATSEDRLSFVTFLEGSVRGLAAGAPVEMRGIRIGSVTEVRLEYDGVGRSFRVRVRLAVEPDRISYPTGRPPEQVRAAAERMVAAGLRVRLRSGNLLTGQKVLGLDFEDGAPPAEAWMEGEEIALPSLGGDAEDVMATVSAIAGRLERFPIEEIGRSLADTLASANAVVGGPELRGAMSALAATLAQVQGLVRRTDAGLAPVLRRLPETAARLDAAVAAAEAAIGSVERGYGADSAINRQMERLMQQATDTARSVRLLTDYLERHPEALIRGRDGR